MVKGYESVENTYWEKKKSEIAEDLISQFLILKEIHSWL